MQLIHINLHASIPLHLIGKYYLLHYVYMRDLDG